MAKAKLVAQIHGIDGDGEVVHITVHKDGRTVTFSGDRTGEAHPSNLKNIDEWQREVIVKWQLTEVVAIPASAIGTSETKAQLEALNLKATNLREESEKSGPAR
jgi:predicted metallo-beta-lactamase superfamily hydrolase